jgi:hypothetical protein
MNSILEPLKKYGETVKEKYKTSIANEHTFRTALENLLNEIKPKEIKIEQETKKQEFELGTPDFRIFKQIDSKEKLTYPNLIGYIECKKPTEDLDKIINTAQIKKYLEVSPNIILTNYNRFILLSFDKKIGDITLFPYGLDDDNLFSEQNDITEKTVFSLEIILKEFFNATSRTIKSKKELVKVLSSQAFYVAFKTMEYIQNKKNNNSKFTRYFNKTYESFKEAVNYDFEIEEFCDIFGQSIVYGLFVAHLEAKDNKKSIDEIEDFISSLPNEFSLLSEFLYFSAPSFNIPIEISYAIANIKKTIALINKEKIADDLNTDIDGISIYLYEDFLKSYDDLKGTEKRKEGGVFFTPEPIVKFIVGSINNILKDKLDIKKGFGGSNVKTLDFATGTGSFLAEVFKIIIEQEKTPVFKISTIKDKFLKDIYGFEIMFVPYIVAHLKLSKILKNEGFHDFNDENRLQIYLTNTLDLDQRKFIMSMPLLLLEEEYEKANHIKNKEEVLVIIGNPPYNVRSRNKGNKILQLLQTYKDGLNERKINLGDDYIKFIRFAQWKLLEQGQKTLFDESKTKKGIMGFITNNSFLWGRTHRKMRESLYKAFDEIYILNLHGSDKDPQDDQNVFDIKTGVCISLFIKHNLSNVKKSVKYFSTLDNGIKTRKQKFEELTKKYTEINWKELDVTEPYYWFIDKNFNNDEYEEFFPLDKIFNIIGSGNKAERDMLTQQLNLTLIESVVEDMRKLNAEDIRKKYSLGKDSRDWGIERAKNDVINNNDDKYYTLLSYRPFDIRYTYFTGKSKGFWGTPSSKISPHFLYGDNVGLLFTKSYDKDFYDAPFVTKNIADIHLSGGQSYIAPLYLLYFNELENIMTESKNFTDSNEMKKLINFTDDFVKFINSKPYKDATPEQILGYIYAILYSPSYRNKYYEYLKINFPKIPFTSEKETFFNISSIGQELIKLHLMEIIPNCNEIYLDSIGNSTNQKELFTIIKINSKNRYKEQKIYLNNHLYINGISEDIWNYTIGGYQVLDKWIKARIDYECSKDELEHLVNTCKIIKKTIELQQVLLKIDFDNFI